MTIKKCRHCDVSFQRPDEAPIPHDRCDRCHEEIEASEHLTETFGQIETKPTNPKDAIGAGKLPLHLWPDTASAMGCIGLLDGMLKYGRSNWRPGGVRASIYVDACRRHLTAWFEGEDDAPDSGVPHLGHALACLAILVDAQAAGRLNDDRMYPGGYHALVEKLTPHVGRLKEQHADKSPKHYTIDDAKEGVVGHG